MVFTVDSVSLEEAPQSVSSLYHQFPKLREAARTLVDKRRQVVAGARSLYLTVREFAISHNQDSKLDIMGTDNLANNVAIIIKNQASGSSLVSHVDRLSSDDLETMVTSLTGLTMSSSPFRLQISLIGGFADNKNVSASLLLPILGTIHANPHYFEVGQLCVGEACTSVARDTGLALPLVTGVGLSLKTGELFPAMFTDKGPDMDLRLARTLTGGEKVGMLAVYDCVHEEMVIGPFTYSPMRAVDIWLQQNDQFLLQSLSPCPEAIEDKERFTASLRATLRVIKEHPYPSVTLFPANNSRNYRKDNNTGHWVARSSNNNVSAVSTAAPTSTTAAAAWYPQQYIKTEASLSYKEAGLGYKAESLTYKTDPAFNINNFHHFKHEAMPWQSMQPLPQAYY